MPFPDSAGLLSAGTHRAVGGEHRRRRWRWPWRRRQQAEPSPDPAPATELIFLDQPTVPFPPVDPSDTGDDVGHVRVAPYVLGVQDTRRFRRYPWKES